MISLTGQNKFAIKHYKYTGGDTSLTYKYILSPFAQFCVDTFVPIWVAPNVITLSGLLITIFVSLLTLVYNPNLNTDCPRWLCFSYAIAIFAYQTLDNMDGKQARRTQSSSALGMLFDHSCDVINTVVIGFLMASSIGTGWTLYSFLGHIAGYIPFFFQTWEEFHMGTLVLPIFNGPSEGLLMSVTVCLISGVFGPHWWHESKIFTIPGVLLNSDKVLTMEVQPLQIVFGVSFFLMITTAIYQVFKVLISQRSSKATVLAALSDLLPILVFSPSVTVWAAYSSVALPQYPLLSYLLMGSIFAELAFKNILVHLIDEPFQPLSRHTAWLSFVLPLSTCMSPSVEFTLMIALFILSATLLTLNLYSAVTGFATVLDIPIFVIPTKRKHS